MNDPDSTLQFTLERLLDAPRERVFSLWSQAHHLRRWFGPADFRIDAVEIDFRPGGVWRVEIVDAAGERHRMGGVYREIVPPERLVFSHAWEDAQGEPGHLTLVTVSLLAAGRQTRLRFHQAVFVSAASCDSHREGWTECLDRLADYIALN